MSDYNEILESKIAEILRAKKKRKIRFAVTLGALSIAAIGVVSVASYAWFSLRVSESHMTTVSGDLNFDIKKVTAYKYVYPFFKNSTELVDYESAHGQVKGYVLEDSDYAQTVSSSTATIALGSKVTGKTYTNTINNNNSQKIMFDTDETFNYFLFGDNLFSGMDENPWSSLSAVAFQQREEITAETPAISNEVTLSAGATFIFFDRNDIGAGTSCSYNSYTSIAESNSAFEITEGHDAIRCLKTGIYKFTMNGTTLRIDTINRVDNSIITNNTLDPTMINLDYSGGRVNTRDPEVIPYYPTIQSYIPDAIQKQNTMVIIDVELACKNAAPIDLNLSVERERSELSPTVFNYADTTNNLIGYVSESQRNALYASDFYCFSALLAKEENQFETANAIWTAMHVPGDSETDSQADFVKFPSNAFQYSVNCNVRPKEDDDSLTIPGNDPDSLTPAIYHCYIGIEYDYQYMDYFLNRDRLGKTYLLDRDFGFHFKGIQHLES